MMTTVTILVAYRRRTWTAPDSEAGGGGLHAAVRGCRERTTHAACLDGPASAATARREYNTHISRVLRRSAGFDRRTLARSLLMR